MAVYRATKMSTDPPLSLASQLPQEFVVLLKVGASKSAPSFV
jgi:hypothetical protein